MAHAPQRFRRGKEIVGGSAIDGHELVELRIEVCKNPERSWNSNAGTTFPSLVGVCAELMGATGDNIMIGMWI
jgi:hypothetical protein